MIVKLMSYNIRYGGGGRGAHLAAVIREAAPDLVVFQEATEPRLIERLAAETGLPVWAARKGYSLAFISREEVSHYEWHRPRGAQHAFLEIVPNGTQERIFGLHLSAVHANWRERRRVRELQSLLHGIARHQHGFHVLVGDFNTLAPGELLEMRRLPVRLWPFIWLSGGRIRWTTVQTLLDAGYTDGYRTLHPHDKGFTFPTWDPHVRLDYVFMPTPFAARLKTLEIVNHSPVTAQASDHFPILAHLEIA